MLMDVRLYGLVLATFLLIMALIGVGWVIKLQLALISLILLVMLSIVVGSLFPSFPTDGSNKAFIGLMDNFKCADDKCPFTVEDNAKMEEIGGTGSVQAGFFKVFGELNGVSMMSRNMMPEYTQTENSATGELVEYNFFSVFSIFFPAVTGIMAGANISGLLENPAENIPRGTLHAIGWSTLAYMLLAFLLGATIAREELVSNNFIMVDVDLSRGLLVLAGIYAATFSSALASIVGAPQMLMAVASDNLIGCLRPFAVTHKRIGMSFIRCPFVEKIDPTFSRLSRWYLLGKVLYNTEATNNVQIHGPELMKEAEMLRQAETTSREDMVLQLKRWKVVDGKESASTISRPIALMKYVDTLIKKLSKPHREELNAFEDHLFDSCMSLDQGALHEGDDVPPSGTVSLLNLERIIGGTDFQSEVDEEKMIGNELMMGARNFPAVAQGLLQHQAFSSAEFCNAVSGKLMDKGMLDEEIRYGKLLKQGDPIRAYFLTYAISMCAIVIGDLNTVAPLISMFFMMTYGLLNYACFFNAQSKSPGWRPTFTYFNSGTGLLGTILCVVAMFLTDIVAAIGSFVLAFLLWNYITFTDPDVNWGSATEASKYMQAVKHVMKLRTLKTNAKTFRPNYLLLTTELDNEGGNSKLEGDDKNIYHLLRFAHTLRKGYGVCILGNVKFQKDPKVVNKVPLEEDSPYFDMRAGWTAEDGVDEFTSDASCLSKLIHNTRYKGFAAFSNVTASNLREGANMLVQASGLGKLKPNTLIMGWKSNWMDLLKRGGSEGEKEVQNYFYVIQDACKNRKGVMIPRNLRLDLDKRPPTVEESSRKTIDVWWVVDDGGLTLLVPHIMMKAQYWEKRTRSKGRKIRLMALMDDDVSRINEVRARFRSVLDKYRLDWELEPISLSRDEDLVGDISSGNLLGPNNALPGVEKVSKQKKSDWVMRWLRIGELIADYSEHASCVFVTLPFPRSWVKPLNYLGWLEILGRNKSPVIFIRGNGRQEAITNLAE
eukprot:g5717.t1